MFMYVATQITSATIYLCIDEDPVQSLISLNHWKHGSHFIWWIIHAAKEGAEGNCERCDASFVRRSAYMRDFFMFLDACKLTRSMHCIVYGTQCEAIRHINVTPKVTPHTHTHETVRERNEEKTKWNGKAREIRTQKISSMHWNEKAQRADLFSSSRIHCIIKHHTRAVHCAHIYTIYSYMCAFTHIGFTHWTQHAPARPNETNEWKHYRDSKDDTELSADTYNTSIKQPFTFLWFSYLFFSLPLAWHGLPHVCFHFSHHLCDTFNLSFQKKKRKMTCDLSFIFHVFNAEFQFCLKRK